MKGSKKDLIKYRIDRAWDTLDDAIILRDKEKCIHSYLHGDKKEIMMTCLTLTKIEYYHILNLLKNCWSKLTKKLMNNCQSVTSKAILNTGFRAKLN